ncbi:glutathione hydrolase 1 proenzyme-like isoform X1 [Chiloscyllium plagiosum]|uniref:glutathione hydrolase 1 proenzyme-like isoform X1 n=1 Tax=Chiloscyllium plagiosum TaxID=36176 RepID=UPI001CB7C470|nr:glutathione hydrolase 1 proenzyme-like isoform X1 [Chiloscyllium plagiosum]
MVEENPTEINVLSEDGLSTKPPQSEIKEDDTNHPARNDSGRLKNRKNMYSIIGVFLIIIVAICIGAIVHLFQRCSACAFHPNTGVASDAKPCSKIGSFLSFRDMMKWNGSGVDAAIAALLCIGLVNAHSMGIGGGLIFTIYNAPTGQVEVINSREVAPAQEITQSLETGGPSIAVPGEIRGYALAHQWHGRLPWKLLFEPSITLARKGFPVGKSLAIALEANKVQIEASASLCDVFCKKNSNQILSENDIIYFPQLANTLQMIADLGPNAFYDGPVAEDIVNYVSQSGGQISHYDLKQYKANKEMPLNVTVDGYTLYVPGAPSGGPVLALILKILEGYNFSRESISTREKKVLTYHRIIEAFKFAFAERSKLEYPTSSDHTKVNEMISKASDIREKISNSHTHENIDYYGIKCFLPGQDGTSHLSVVAQDGSAVSVTSTINGRFGSFVRSNVTGIIFNNQMADFSQYEDNKSLPPCSQNYVQPGRRPFSAMSPAIILDKDKKVKMVVGASGSARIITATALVIINVLWFGDDACEAVNKPRIHHQLIPNFVQFESEDLASNEAELRLFRKEIEDALKKKIHASGFADMPSVVQAIVREGNLWHAVSDTKRKGGCPAGY